MNRDQGSIILYRGGREGWRKGWREGGRDGGRDGGRMEGEGVGEHKMNGVTIMRCLPRFLVSLFNKSYLRIKK